MAAAAILEKFQMAGATGRPIQFLFRFKIYTFYAVVSSVA